MSTPIKRLRYRNADLAVMPTLRLARDWPWSGQLAAAFARLQALPAPAG